MKRLLPFVAALLLLAPPDSPPVRAQAVGPSPRLVNEYGDVDYEDEIARLDSFAVDLQNEPSARAHTDGRSAPWPEALTASVQGVDDVSRPRA